MERFPGGPRRRASARARAGKAVGKVLVAIAVILVVAVVGAVVFLDSIARAGIAAAGSHALGTKMEVRSASIGLVSGHTTVEGIAVDNPAGYSEQHLVGRNFVKVKSIAVDAGLRDLLGERIEIERIALEAVDVAIVRAADGTLNVQRFADHLGASKGKPSAESGSSREVLVRELSLRGVRVHLFGFVGDPGRRIDVDLPDVVLRDLSSKGSVDVLASEVSGVVVGSVLSAVVAARIEGLGADVLGGLETAASGIGAAVGGPLREAVETGIASVEGALRQLDWGFSDSVGAAGKAVGDTIKKGVGDALEGVFGGEKK